VDRIGGVHPITVEVRGDTGALINASGVTLTVTRPDGTSTQPVVTNPPAVTGRYLYDWLNAVAGWHQWSLTTSSPNTASGDAWHVNSGLPGIISLGEAKDHLNKNAATYVDDEELRDFIDCASEWVEKQVGPVRRQTVVQRATPIAGRLWLDGPVISVASIVSTGGLTTTYTVADYDLDSEAGTLIAKAGVPALSDDTEVSVTYVAGQPVFSALVRSATKDYLLWDWRSQRGSTPLPLMEAEAFAAEPGSVPYKIREKLRGTQEPVWA